MGRSSCASGISAARIGVILRARMVSFGSDEEQSCAAVYLRGGGT